MSKLLPVSAHIYFYILYFAKSNYLINFANKNNIPTQIKSKKVQSLKVQMSDKANQIAEQTLQCISKSLH